MKISSQQQNGLRFANFLSPLMQETYQRIAEEVGRRLAITTSLHTGATLDEFEAGEADLGFLCGLLYVRLRQRSDCPVDILAAPVLSGERYQGRPIYFSDVIVRKASVYTSFDDLAGCRWAYNERASHSGCNVVSYSLLERKKDPNYFGSLLQTGSHLQSVQAVVEGEADAAAIDSHVLAVFLQRNPQIAADLRTIDVMGPSSVPPVVISKRIAPELKKQLQTIFLRLHQDEGLRPSLQAGLIEQFVAVEDKQYGDIESMLKKVEAVSFPFV
ncbi:PhnD/SsuA/transferrin family substrate-binding protein [Tengunoibacter tsumagoiensis]|uniref:Phosphate ABC transporter substrate-binding protein n=1 Tax=Tengunoibacter tsumagoiensis TaxID=2014871 RepID=A0A402A6B0_9CHLR|nr:PhnD/SsuA/transferrin family substrate-binding protein [Tengunoibacter tsumagoiensis]GCE14670.1 hypothetical protein KTT_45290 [Tengunoibacter tsumagoiensis]